MALKEAPQLAQGDVHRGVGDAPVPLHVRAPVLAPAEHVALQHRAVVGQALGLAVAAQVGVVAEAGRGRHGLVVGQPLVAHEGQQPLDGGPGEVARARRQRRGRRLAGRVGVEAELVPQPALHLLRILFVKEPLDRFLLALDGEGGPALAEALAVPQRRRRQVAVEARAGGRFEVDARPRGQPRHGGDALERLAADARQFGRHALALVAVEGPVALPRRREFEVRHLLPDAEALEQRVRLVGAFLPRQQRALPHLDGPQRALEQDRVDDGVPVLGGDVGMVRGLRRADGAQLGLDHRAVGVEAVAEARADGLALPPPSPQVLPQRARAGLPDAPPQLARVLADGAVLARVRLAVAAEAAAVGEGQQRAPQLVRRERAVERHRAQLQRVERAGGGAFGHAVRQQVEVVEQVGEAALAAQRAVAVAAGAALLAPLGRVRGPALRVAPVRMDEHAAVEQRLRLLRAVEAVERPADAVGAEVQPETEHVDASCARFFTERR